MINAQDPAAARTAAEAQLRPGEHLLWVGSSDPRAVFTRRDGYLIPFSLLWTTFVGFTFFGESVKRVSGVSAVPLTVVPGLFLVVGLYMLVGRFFVKAHRKRTEVYAVSDLRSFITNGSSTREVPRDRSDRMTSWSAGHRRVSVEWAAPNAGSLFLRSNGIYTNTGLDIIGPRTFGFFDVLDGQALVAALDRSSIDRSRARSD